jgi:hypothetical protein
MAPKESINQARTKVGNLLGSHFLLSRIQFLSAHLPKISAKIEILENLVALSSV